SIDPTLRKSRNNLAVVLLQTGRAAEAIPEAEMLTRVHPLFSTGWHTLGLARLQNGDLSEADIAFGQAQDLSPLDADTAFRRGSVAWLQDHEEAAAGHWRRAIELDPGHADARRALEMARTRVP
ncbi:MAG: tetratricopeptide repeat protein, partial [Myxococcota bacterium]|nr:tetratricopeptide repeat protein [Myxococcota bacterium]